MNSSGPSETELRYLTEEDAARLQDSVCVQPPLEAVALLDWVRRCQRRLMARREDLSSDSETEGLADAVKSKMDLTPAGSTPQELVKLDPSEVGMSVGYKHL